MSCREPGSAAGSRPRRRASHASTRTITSRSSSAAGLIRKVGERADRQLRRLAVPDRGARPSSSRAAPPGPMIDGCDRDARAALAREPRRTSASGWAATPPSCSTGPPSTASEIASAAVEAEVRLRRRGQHATAFLRDYLAAVGPAARRSTAPASGAPYRVALAVYPRPRRSTTVTDRDREGVHRRRQAERGRGPPFADGDERSQLGSDDLRDRPRRRQAASGGRSARDRSATGEVDARQSPRSLLRQHGGRRSRTTSPRSP